MMEKICSRCKSQPAREGQRWCKSCRADYMRDHRAVRAAENREGFLNRRERNAGRGTPTTGVYFMACDGFIKIGVSIDVVRRYYAIKNANPHDVRQIAFIPAETFAEAQRIETSIHGLFIEHLHRGEWFRDGPIIRDFIKQHAKNWPAFTDFEDEMPHGPVPYGAVSSFDVFGK